MTRTALAAALALAAGCASAPAPDAAPFPAAYSLEVRFVRAGGETVAAPRLFVFAGQSASVQVLSRESYVRTFEMEATSDGLIVDPVVGTVHEGVLLEARVFPLEDGSGARLDYTLKTTGPRRPFRERRLEIEADPPLTVQVPEVESTEVEGVALLADGEERSVAVLPWPGGDGGTVSVLARIVPADPSAVSLDAEVPDRPVPVPRGEVGWHRIRVAWMDRDMEQGAVLQGRPLRDLLDGGVLVVERDLQWTGVAGATPGVRVTEERPYLADHEIRSKENRGIVVSPLFRTISFGLVAASDPDGGVLFTRSTLLPVQTFPVNGGHCPPVTIDLPELRVRRATVPAGSGERLLVLGPREGGGSDAVILSFRPGARGPEE